MALSTELPGDDPRPPALRARSSGLAYGGLAIATLGWATGFIAGKLALEDMTPLVVAGWRHVLAALLLLPFAWRQRPATRLGSAAMPLAVMVVCGGVLYPCLFLGALVRTSATTTSLLIALNPVLTVLASPLVGERLDARRVTGIAIALCGAVLVITRGHLGDLAELTLDPGDLLALAAAAAWTCFNLASHRAAAHLAPAFSNCVIYALGSAALLLLSLSDGPWAQLTGAGPTALGGLTAMAVLSSVIAGQLFLVGVAAVGINRAVVFVYVVPVLTAVLAAILLDERLSGAQAIGGAAVLAGVVVATWEGVRRTALRGR
jgi:drug/metabolite transporter (DMT)-like permease